MEASQRVYCYVDRQSISSLIMIMAVAWSTRHDKATFSDGLGFWSRKSVSADNVSSTTILGMSTSRNHTQPLEQALEQKIDEHA